MCVAQQNNSPTQHDCGRQDDSALQELAQELLQLFLCPTVAGLGHVRTSLSSLGRSFDAEADDDDAEDEAQRPGLHHGQHPRSKQCSREYTQHDRRGQARVDVTAGEINAGMAAAVTPIMKLLVVVDTLNGRRMVWSMASTLRGPEPMPSKPESAPATNIRPKPVGTRSTS